MHTVAKWTCTVFRKEDLAGLMVQVISELLVDDACMLQHNFAIEFRISSLVEVRISIINRKGYYLYLLSPCTWVFI